MQNFNVGVVECSYSKVVILRLYNRSLIRKLFYAKILYIIIYM